MEYLELGILGILGIILHVIVKIKPKVIAKEKIEWRAHIINTIFSVIILGVLIWLKDDVEDVYPLTKLNIFITGYAADSVFRNIMGKALGKMGIKQ